MLESRADEGKMDAGETSSRLMVLRKEKSRDERRPFKTKRWQ